MSDAATPPNISAELLDRLLALDEQEFISLFEQYMTDRPMTKSTYRSLRIAVARGRQNLYADMAYEAKIQAMAEDVIPKELWPVFRAMR